MFSKDDQARIEERVDILRILFSFKKNRGQKLPLADVDATGSLAILDVASCSVSSPSSTEETSSDASSTSSSDDRRRACSVSLVKKDSPQGNGGSVASSITKA